MNPCMITGIAVMIATNTPQIKKYNPFPGVPLETQAPLTNVPNVPRLLQNGNAHVEGGRR